jgi:hypothetical protein
MILAIQCALAGLAAVCVLLRARRIFRRGRVVGFLHPYCASGGGGERVLWVSEHELMSNILFLMMMMKGWHCGAS